jgi:hypothetical protein
MPFSVSTTVFILHTFAMVAVRAFPFVNSTAASMPVLVNVVREHVRLLWKYSSTRKIKRIVQVSDLFFSCSRR